MAYNTRTQVAGPVDVDFQVQLLRTASPLCPYFQGTNQASISMHDNTFTAKWRRVENLTPVTTALAELSGAPAFPTRTGSSLSVTDMQATLQKYGDFIFLNEEVDLINTTAHTAEYATILGKQAGRSLNRLQRNVAEDSLTAILAGSGTTASVIIASSTATSFLNRSEIQNAVNILDRNDATKFTPRTTGSQNIGTSAIRASYLGFIHPDTTAHLRSLTAFVEAHNYAAQTETFNGEVGYVDGVRWIETTESSIDTTAGSNATGSATTNGRSTATRYDLYNAVIVGKDALGSLGFGVEHVKESYVAGDKLPAVIVVNHKRGDAGAADPLNEVSTMGWKSWHAGVVLNSAWGRVIRHTAPLLDTLE